MKTHEFARQLEILAKLLRQLPDTELEEMHLSALIPTPSLSTNSIKESTRHARPLPPGIEKQLIGMTVAQVEAFLGSEEEAFTVANLSELAERLGITTSKRQNKSALINLITRSVEAEKMHSIIRGTGSDEPKTT
jgi:hypothetical protein